MLVKYFKRKNGKLHGGPINAKTAEGDFITIMPGITDIADKDWAHVRGLANIANYLKSGVLVEIGGKVKQEIVEPPKPMTSKEFKEEGILSKEGNTFIITLGEQEYRVIGTKEDKAHNKAYSSYVEDFQKENSGKQKIIYSVASKSFDKLEGKEREDVISNTFDLTTLKKWKDKTKSEEARLLVIKQIEAVENYEVKANQNSDQNED